MVQVVSKHLVKGDKINDFIENARELVEKTLKEEGCINYGLYQDQKDSNVLTFIEEWESGAALDKHMTTEHFCRIVPILKDFDERQGDLNKYNKVI